MDVSAHLEFVSVHERAAFLLFYPNTNDHRCIQMAWWPAAMDMKWSILCRQLEVQIPNTISESPDDGARGNIQSIVGGCPADHFEGRTVGGVLDEDSHRDTVHPAVL